MEIADDLRDQQERSSRRRPARTGAARRKASPAPSSAPSPPKARASSPCWSTSTASSRDGPAGLRRVSSERSITWPLRCPASTAAIPFYQSLGLTLAAANRSPRKKYGVAVLPPLELLEPAAAGLPDREIPRETRPRPAPHRAARPRSRRCHRSACAPAAPACSTNRAPALAATSTFSFTPPPPEAYFSNSFRSNRESRNRHHRRQRTLLHARLRSAGRSQHPTPFGAPSDNYIIGKLAGREVAFLARHGRGHRISPIEINFRANIYGMKSLGVERIISLSAVGSLKEEHHPLDFVLPDQFFDRTRGRVSTFFGDGLVAHISFADPICPQLSAVVAGACRDAGVNVEAGRHIPLHGGAGLLHQGRIQRLPLLGHGRDRHDQPAGGQAGARGRDLLRHRRHGDRLRLLARRSRRRHRAATSSPTW